VVWPLVNCTDSGWSPGAAGKVTVSGTVALECALMVTGLLAWEAEAASCSVSQRFRSAGASESRTARNIALLTLHVDRGLDSQALPRPRHGHNPKPQPAGRCEGSHKRRCYVF
jgi:hypothetical protein